MNNKAPTLLIVEQRLDYLEARLNNIEKNYYKDAAVSFDQMHQSVSSIRSEINELKLGG